MQGERGGCTRLEALPRPRTSCTACKGSAPDFGTNLQKEQVQALSFLPVQCFVHVRDSTALSTAAHGRCTCWQFLNLLSR